jgi:hypothetical protein
MGKQSAPQAPKPYNTASPFGSDTFSAKGANGVSGGTQTLSFSPQTQSYLNKDIAAYNQLLNRADAIGGGTPAVAARPDVFTKNGKTVDVGVGNDARIANLEKQGYKLTKQGTAGQAATPSQLPSSPFSTSGLPYNPSGISIQDPSSFQAQADKAAQAAFAEQKGMLQPGFDQAQRQLETSLSDRGIPLGSEIDKNERNLLASQQNNALQQAAQGSVLAGNQEQNTLFGENVSGANAKLGINNQAMQQALTQRELPYNEMSAYLSGQPVTFGSTPSAQNIMPMQEANYQTQVGQYNNQQAGLANGLFGIGSGILGAMAPGGFLASDRRLKKDIKKIGEFDKGLNLWSFRYKWDHDDSPKHVGLMAQEVEKVVPDAVSFSPDGYRMVDYGQVGQEIAS